MARPKKVSDSEILLIAFEVISNEGFESFTFEQVSRATGLSPAALVKRFKTKKRLAFLARNQKWDENMAKMNTTKISELNGLNGIFEFLRLIAKSVDSKRLGEHLRWLGTEAEDPKAKKKVASYFAETRGIFRRLIEEAIANREIKKVSDPEDLAMTLEALVQGSIFQFGFLNERNIERHLVSRFRSALQPFTS
ncbi:TetR family transcriptional regulator [Bdellovibrio sp. 22V]|uniref:TetR/AcrR family transcriptional regulator n=1 Tax=Bdellovibrio sp. 22V TaxID=3044166 RepID=UPI002542B17C|nr:TetR family transcriptional regulator [Bdellovibrio sp. 22V]WII70853.1 TetR family transcriptional regulator [Bdellovibrio sp. 22V]